jgi:hypothetical protein
MTAEPVNKAFYGIGNVCVVCVVKREMRNDLGVVNVVGKGRV